MSGMSIDISRPWARTPTDHCAGRPVDFSPSTNKAREADRLIAAESPVAAKIEIHGIKVVGPRHHHAADGEGARPAARYRDHAEAARLSSLDQELKAPLAKGEKVPVTLTFEKAGTAADRAGRSRRRARSATRRLMEGQPG